MYAVCKTDIGQVRSSNQDICRCGTFSDGSAWTVVCDGMGGVNGGNIASSVACDAICKAITENYTPDMEEDAVRDIMLHAINDANAAVLHRAQEDPALNGMGTTVVVSIAAGGVLHIAHAGDSRCYLKTALGVKQVTTDHSFVQQLVESGAITEDEARVHPQRNLITRVVGVHPEVECDYGCYKFEPGDLALSCTDGLSNYLERDTGLLAGLWQFPNVPQKLDAQTAVQTAQSFHTDPKELMLETHKTHIFTHIRWEMTGYVIRCNAMSEAFTWASLAELERDFALPTAFRQFSDELKTL